MDMRVNKDLLVQLQYELFRLDEEGNEEFLEATSPDEPLTFIHGMGLMLPAFESELIGLSAGDEFDFHLVPEDAYGEVEDELFLSLPREVFLVDGKFDTELVYEGAQLPLMTSDGQQVMALVLNVYDDEVHVDLNHPLAGDTLHFRGKIEVVKEPTPEEFSAIFSPHHSGCGCCCDTDEDGCCGCH